MVLNHIALQHIKQVQQTLRLNGTDTYVKIPEAVVAQKTMTIAMWTFINTTNAWMRLFDFGNNINQYIFFSPNTGSESRFVMKMVERNKYCLRISCQQDGIMLV